MTSPRTKRLPGAVRPWPALAGIAALAVAVTVYGDVDGWLRSPLVVSFLLVFPGLAVVRLLRLADRLAELTLGIALSVALAVIASSAMLYSGAWSPKLMLALLLAVTLAGAAIELLTDRSSPVATEAEQ